MDTSIGAAMLVYYFNCGHRATHSVKLKARGCGAACPICLNGSIMAAKAYCDVCGSYIKMGRAQNTRNKYCSSCKRGINRKNQRRFLNGESKPQKHLSETILESSLRRFDCVQYAVCLKAAALENANLDCTGCDQYVHAHLDVMDFLKCESPLARAADKWPVYTNLGKGAKRGVKTHELALSKR